MTTRSVLLAVAAAAALSVSGHARTPATQSDSRDADRAAIRAHIESICQAFLEPARGDWRSSAAGHVHHEVGRAAVARDV